ncbi:hypothetical protein D9M68_430810 [compost metagenome]
MTAIAIWRNDEAPSHPSLWVAADSRVTAQRHTVLVEDAAKVLSLPIVCRAQNQEGFFTEVYHSHSVGYCFAGSTLMGQNVYLGLTPLLSNLISPVRYVPSLEDVAAHLFSYLRRSFDDFKVRAGSTAMFEAAMFGACPRTKSLCVYHFRPKLKEGVYELTCTRHATLQDGEFVYLGDESIRVSQAIADARTEPCLPGRPKSRLPRYVIEDFINDPTYETIGGDVQLAVADWAGFRPYILCKPRVPGEPQAYLSYLGRELTEDIRTVGHAIVGGPAMI